MTRVEGRRPTNTIWLFCEGEKTEKFYFQKLKATERISRFSVEVVAPGKSDALGLINYVKRFKQSHSRDFQEDDIIYCIFDRNDNSNQKLNQAVRLAEENGVNIIFSNPCFEYWIVSHFAYYPHICDFNDLKSKLEEHMTRYEKNDREIYIKTKDKVTNAIKHSKRIGKKHIENGVELISRESNPSTKVYEIIERFKELKQQESS